MARLCSICQRGAITGYSRSHSNIATKRRMSLNLQKRQIDGIRVLVCTSCLRTLKRKAEMALAPAAAQ